MEPRPAVAWVLLLTVILDLLKATHSRDFSEQDIVYLHPSTTPFPGGFKCFTCEDAPDNFQCNRWAPDVYCPREAKYCYTRHMMDADGGSVSVTKRCAAVEDCLSSGCSATQHDGSQVFLQMCSACCEGNICNLSVPWNQTDAVFTATSSLSSGAGRPRSRGVAAALVSASLIMCRTV
ncbi:ly6/PLAUR domain-containing protein 6 [Salarias fasciatus]|uniref:Ly6/PLAUR domain-containing protein 6-like n=1 Tax=Salarias fasciatus TaxID=181472 RepID=A0A672HLC3_SALFA|nr:ly6/PLAUR domain-containing protein 6-like [Salarias fasciatus]XP_029967770.1 ly6/PLAUR domain-containing protein 6-like [Salarias fasciatus]